MSHLADIVETALRMQKVPFIDYVLVYETGDDTLETPRRLFEQEMEKGIH